MDKSPDDQILIGYAIAFGAVGSECGRTRVNGAFVYAGDATSADDATGKAYLMALKAFPVADGYYGHWGMCSSIVHVRRDSLKRLAENGAAAILDVPGYEVV